jgi:hypothetical protein
VIRSTNLCTTFSPLLAGTSLPSRESKKTAFLQRLRHILIRHLHHGDQTARALSFRMMSIGFAFSDSSRSEVENFIAGLAARSFSK